MKYSNKTPHYFNGARPEVLKFLPKNFKTFLDVGCGAGGNINLLKSHTEQSLEAWGVEYVEEEAKKAASYADRVLVGSIEDNLKNLPDNYFEVITCLDVLEHLVYPEEVLKSLKGKLKEGGVLISSIPNVRHFTNIYNLLIKRDWRYEEAGILDYTHLRFFTSKSIIRMFNSAGFEIIKHEGINPARWWKYFIINLFTLFMFNDGRYIQFVTVAKDKK